MFTYGQDFYEMQMAGSAQSASVIVPVILEMIPAKSVCDVGCGVGTWLRAFADNGVPDLLGLDGEYVDSKMLKVSANQFRPTNLEQSFQLARKFDLAVSLEVAEHLPETRAEGFVADLTRLAPVIVFSAAIPNQGGVNHVNEQWPSWWANLFAKHGFNVCDVIRRRIWDREDVTPCYRQNVLVFAKPETVAANPHLVTAKPEQIDIAHPIFYSRLLSSNDTRALAKHLWWAVNRNLRKRR